MRIETPKPVIWIASAKKDLLSFPEEVKETVGYALYLGACPRIGTVARGSCFEPDFFHNLRRILSIFNENYGKIGPKSAFPQ